ncbi:MAG: hypothetical protein RLW62_08530 [Gammaproteobacteria bacterium]
MAGGLLLTDMRNGRFQAGAMTLTDTGRADVRGACMAAPGGLRATRAGYRDRAGV